MAKIILASGSPRRKELLSRITSDFQINIPKIDEIFNPDLKLEDALIEVALGKAKEVYKRNNDKCVISADTIVVFKNQVLGKPKDEKDAYHILKSLSGQEHYVYTGVCILFEGREYSFVSKTKVLFFELADEEIKEYILSKEPMDKAGAYGIQGLGGLFVKGIEGDYYNVVGFPISIVAKWLKKLKVI